MLQRKKPLNSVLIKPAGADCNLNCAYCFYLKRAELFPEQKTHRMSSETLEIMIKQVMEQGERHISFGWQGGEPTLMGLPFFEKAVYFQKKYGRGQSVGNGLQTNGILLDEKWAKFLKQYHFLVGISLDGPEHVHDFYRLKKSGEGSWQTVVNRAKMLLDQGVETNVLSVLTDYSARFPDEIYEFHKSLGLNFMQFIPCLEPDPLNPQKAADFSLTPQRYGEFLVRLFDLWLADFKDGKPTTSVRYFDSVFYEYVGLRPPECTLLAECGVYAVIEHNGDVYSCDFYVEPKWRLGNIHQGRIIDMLNSPQQKKFGLIKRLLPRECQNCEWLRNCRGGCPKDRRQEELNHFCQSFKMFFEHADSRLRKLAIEWKAQNQPQHVPQTANVKKSAEITGKVKPNDPCPCGSGKKYKKCCGVK
ncbi:MAG: anaerobic sulfatase maturase [Calditrichaeota bacterium]|nr:anaerobic sulfatase maturase [Calditrichota bacterium]